MDFTVFLVPKLEPNFRKLIREIPATSCRKSFLYLNFFCITLEPGTLERRSRSIKTRIIA